MGFQKMKVEMDAQVFLRIAKHAREKFPQSVSGSLLGLDVEEEQTLRVTAGFAYKQTNDDGAQQNSKDFTEYQYQMLQNLSEVRQDANAVGWYVSTSHGTFLTEDFIESQYKFQKSVPNAVAIVYDPFMQKIGKCGFSAYRLTGKAMSTRSMNDGQDDPFAGFQSENLLEEVPITFYASPLAEAFVLQWSSMNFETFDVDGMTPVLERNVQQLLESLDDFSMQQREMQQYERQSRVQKDKMKGARVPKSIDTLNLSLQIQDHCRNLDTFGNDAFSKLYMIGQKDGGEEVADVIGSLSK